MSDVVDDDDDYASALGAIDQANMIAKSASDARSRNDAVRTSREALDNISRNFRV